MLRRFLNWLAGPAVEKQPRQKRRYTRRAKIKKVRRSYERMTPEKLSRAKNLLISGASAVLIAEKVGVSKNTIYRCMNDIKNAHPLFAVKNTNIPEIGGHPTVWKFLKSMRQFKNADCSQISVYAALVDERYLSPYEVMKAMGGGRATHASVQAALSVMARMGLVLRTKGNSPDTGRTCYVYRRHRSNEHVDIRPLVSAAA